MRWVRRAAWCSAPGVAFWLVRRRYRLFICQAEEMTLLAQTELRLLAWEIEHGEPFAWEEDDGR